MPRGSSDGGAGDGDGAGAAGVADGEVEECGGRGRVVEDDLPRMLVVGEAGAVVCLFYVFLLVGVVEE